MKIVNDKTHLLRLSPKSLPPDSPALSVPIYLENNLLPLSPSMEHLGLLRTCDLENVSSLQDRFSKHLRALYPVLSAGAARGYSGNPAASLRVEKIYASPVLFNCLGSLVLNRKERYLLHQHHKNTLSSLMRLPSRCPHEPIFFLAGVPPSEAILDMKMFGLLGMIARLGPRKDLHRLGIYLLSSHFLPPGFIGCLSSPFNTRYRRPYRPCPPLLKRNHIIIL